MTGTQRATQEPTVFIIFGVTGDLSRRKLFPALLDLYRRGLLPERFTVVGFSRREYSHDDFRSFMSEAMTEEVNESQELIADFLSRTFYIPGNFQDTGAYGNLAEFIAGLEQEYKPGQCANKLFYLAVPPEWYGTILEYLADSGLSTPCGGEDGWARVLVEKPFGKDVETAQKLDKKLGLLFQEEQIFRIDHYLAKESIQNILTFRFFNALFEPIWNRENIERVELSLFEKGDAAGRGSFYDAVGALRDVGQNHLLQMLALMAMERPAEHSAGAIQKARAKVLEAITLPLCDEEHVVRGQYEGFRDEKGVEPNSRTETFFSIYAEVNTERWQGVPFILSSGKALSRDEVAVRIFFKREECVLENESGRYGGTNQITFRIHPDEGINVHFWFKKPGFEKVLEERTLSFLYEDKEEQIPDAYERVLFDCINGDRTLFASTDEVLAAWRFIAPLMEEWSAVRTHLYEPGIDPREVKNTPFLENNQ